MSMLQNPILRGFNPDPNIVRVNNDYYIATSTFEWFGGVQIHHSTDLVNWRVIGQALNTVEQLDMRGVPDSCGVWAPQLSYNNGRFYLVYTNVKSFDGPWKDTPNYFVSTTDITGNWSQATYLNSSGFDPSIFHDDDGKSYLLNMLVDHRNNTLFGGIVMQELCLKTNKLIGDVKPIFAGTELGCTEGPHILKRGDYYYLITAEGGTGYEHCISVARAKNIFGPYQVHPYNPVITAAHEPSNVLQKCGHGDFFQTQTGDWYTVFLTSRPLSERGRCITGRETGIEQIIWKDDGWPYAKHTNKAPRIHVPVEGLTPNPQSQPSTHIDFSKDDLTVDFQSLRIPMCKNWVYKNTQKTSLTLVGKESLSSLHQQSFIARRVQAHHTVSSTCVDFAPSSFQQMAGLVCYYNTSHYYYLHISGGDVGDETTPRYLNIISCDKYQTSTPVAPLLLKTNKPVYLKADFNGAQLQFYYATEKNRWIEFGPVLDGSILSDDYVQQSPQGYRPCFTGAFIGMACQDLSGRNKEAHFSFFNYDEPSDE